MAQLRQDYVRFVERDAEVIAVGPERARVFARYWNEHEMPFVGLPDPRHSAARLYGQEVNLLKLGRLPAQVLVDKAGRVRYAHYGASMSDIPDNQELLDLLDQLNREADGP
jgi:peroxiredoxin Q/BCP